MLYKGNANVKSGTLLILCFWGGINILMLIACTRDNPQIDMGPDRVGKTGDVIYTCNKKSRRILMKYLKAYTQLCQNINQQNTALHAIRELSKSELTSGIETQLENNLINSRSALDEIFGAMSTSETPPQCLVICPIEGGSIILERLQYYEGEKRFVKRMIPWVPHSNIDNPNIPADINMAYFTNRTLKSEWPEYKKLGSEHDRLQFSNTMTTVEGKYWIVAYYYLPELKLPSAISCTDMALAENNWLYVYDYDEKNIIRLLKNGT